MVELNKVADLTDSQMDSLKDRAFDLADAVGQTGEEAINAITEVKRAGFTLAESEEVAEYALMMTNVAEGIDDAGDAANILISILKGTNAEVSYASTLLDELNEISNNSAISFDALAEMTQEIAGTMNTLGASTEETMALLTGAYEVLQDERVAKGISVIGLRIQGLTEDLEEEAGLQSTVNDALEKFANITVFDESGQLRNYYDILEDLSEVWDDLSKNAQAYLTTTLAGKNRADVLNALMTNWEGVSEAMQQAADSAGSALQEEQAYLDSISGSLASLKNTWQELSDQALSSDATAFVIKLADGVLTLSKNTGGLWNALLLVLGTIMAIKALKTVTGAENLIGAIQALTTKTVSLNAVLTSTQGIISIVTLSITALVAIISIIKNSIDEMHSANQELISDGDAVADNAIKLKQLSAELETNKNVESEIVDILGDKKVALEGLTEGTEEYTKRLKELIKAEQEENEQTLERAKAAAETELASAGTSTKSVFLSLGDTTDFYEKMGISAKVYGGSTMGVGTNQTYLAGLSSAKTVEAQLQNAKLIAEARDKAYKAYIDNIGIDEDYSQRAYSAWQTLYDAYQEIESYVTAYESATQNLEDFQNALSKTTDGEAETANNLLNSLNSIKDAIDEETEATETATEAEEKQLEIAEKRLAVEKALQELAEAKEKKVQVFRMGQGMVYADDIDAIQTAQEALTEAQADLTEAESEETTTSAVSTLYDEVDSMYNYMVATYGADKLNAYMTEARLAGADTTDTTEQLKYYKQLLASFEAQQQPEWSTAVANDTSTSKYANSFLANRLQNAVNSLASDLVKNQTIINVAQMAVSAVDAEEFADSMANYADGMTTNE